MDKHIRRLTKNGVIENLLAAGETMDPVQMFEAAHAAKGNCGNLGLTQLEQACSEIAEEFRPGRSRSMTDEEVAEKLREIARLYAEAADAVRWYEADNP